MAEPAATSSRAGELPAKRRTNLKVNGWIVYRGTTPVATGATQREAIEEAGRYLCDPAAGLMHLRPAIGDELPPHEAVGVDHPLAAGREVVVRGIERLIRAAEQAGDVHAADVLKTLRHCCGKPRNPADPPCHPLTAAATQYASDPRAVAEAPEA